MSQQSYELCIIPLILQTNKPKEVKYLIKFVIGARIYWYGHQRQWTANLFTGYEDTTEVLTWELDFE